MRILPRKRYAVTGPPFTAWPWPTTPVILSRCWTHAGAGRLAIRLWRATGCRPPNPYKVAERAQVQS